VTEFGSEVARLLDERGMSLRQAARLTHYDPSYLSKVISGLKPGSRQLAEAHANWPRRSTGCSAPTEP
jgi:transcriptional regulator with XRE-family HTH domain